MNNPQSYKILAVDDDACTRMLIGNYLSEHEDALANHEVVLAKSGKEALELIDNSMELILLDIFMPVMGGLDTLVKMKEKMKYQSPGVRFVACTASIEKEKEYLSAGFSEVLGKPFSAKLLNECVQRNGTRYIQP